RIRERLLTVAVAATATAAAAAAATATATASTSASTKTTRHRRLLRRDHLFDQAPRRRKLDGQRVGLPRMRLTGEIKAMATATKSGVKMVEDAGGERRNEGEC
ncbi:hypothetical protein X777_05903, partial [Ooceraea biroi]